MALARMRSLRRTPPSSLTSMTMLPDSWKAFSLIMPLAGLPLATRTSAGSMPWSMALRTRCISGSPIFSTTVLSSSASSPSTTRPMSLPSSRATSCTTRWKRLKVAPIFTMRSSSAASRTSSTRPDSVDVHSCSSTFCKRWPIILVRAPAMINSPTRSISRSSLSESTRTERLSCAFCSLTCFCLASAASTTTGGTLPLSTRMLPSCCWVAGSVESCCSCSASSSSRAVMLPQRTRISPSRAGCSGSALIKSIYCEVWLNGGRMWITQSSWTNSNTPSMASLVALPPADDMDAELCYHVVGRRQRVRHGGDADDPAQLGQVAQEGDRVHAVLQHAGAEAQRDMPVVLGALLAAHAFQVGRVRRRMRGHHAAGGRRGGGGGSAVRTVAAAHVALELFDQRVAGGAGVGVGFGLAGGQAVDQAGEEVAAGQQQHGHLFAQRHAAVAHFIEQAFDDVGEGDDVIEAEQTGRALDGVRGAEDGADGVALVVAMLDVEQRVLHVFEQFAALRDKGLQRVVQIHGGLRCF